MAVASLGGASAFFAGGQLKNGSKSDVVDIFTLATRDEGAPDASVLRTVPLVHSVVKLSSPRSMLAATTVDGPRVTSQYVLFGGGELKENESHTSTTQDSATVDVYDSSLKRMVQSHNLSIARKKHAATTVGQTALFGGGYLSGFGSLASVDLFHG